MTAIPDASKLVLTYADSPKEFFPNTSLVRCETSDWIYLNEGDQVVVERTGMHPKAGVIDVISEDAYVLWVWLEHGEGRIMISAEESDSIWQVELVGQNAVLQA